MGIAPLNPSYVLTTCAQMKLLPVLHSGLFPAGYPELTGLKPSVGGG
jgi:hypothetical protein